MNVQIRTAALAAMVLMSGVLVLSGQEPVESASAPGAFPVTIENCGVSTIYLRPPRRVVTMNQAATELMLELGLENHLVGTAYLDDAILPALAAAYQKIPVLATMYQSRDELTAVQPDFVFAAYPSAFAPEAAGRRGDLGVHSYVSPSSCPEDARSARISMPVIYRELREIGRIFGVSTRAERNIASYQADIEAIQARIGRVNERPRVFWYDAADRPLAGSCCSATGEIIRLAGGENVFDDKPGSWAPVSWDEVVTRNPDVIVIVDASWSPASQKARALGVEGHANIEAVKHQRVITLDFSYTAPGARTAAAVRKLAEALYPEKFATAHIARTAQDPTGVK